MGQLWIKFGSTYRVRRVVVSANMWFQLYLPGRFTHFCGICAALDTTSADVVQMLYECMNAGDIEVKSRCCFSWASDVDGGPVLN